MFEFGKYLYCSLFFFSDSWYLQVEWGIFYWVYSRWRFGAKRLVRGLYPRKSTRSKNWCWSSCQKKLKRFVPKYLNSTGCDAKNVRILLNFIDTVNNKLCESQYFSKTLSVRFKLKCWIFVWKLFGIGCFLLVFVWTNQNDEQSFFFWKIAFKIKQYISVVEIFVNLLL